MSSEALRISSSRMQQAPAKRHGDCHTVADLLAQVSSRQMLLVDGPMKDPGG